VNIATYKLYFFQCTQRTLCEFCGRDFDEPHLYKRHKPKCKNKHDQDCNVKTKPKPASTVSRPPRLSPQPTASRLPTSPQPTATSQAPVLLQGIDGFCPNITSTPETGTTNDTAFVCNREQSSIHIPEILRPALEEFEIMLDNSFLAFHHEMVTC
jgi:hypothetical protein